MHVSGCIVCRHDLDVGRCARGVYGQRAPLCRFGCAAQDVPLEQAASTDERQKCPASVGVRR
eukprot:2029169-Pleurochrysis_carterae.AAC.1